MLGMSDSTEADLRCNSGTNQEKARTKLKNIVFSPLRVQAHFQGYLLHVYLRSTDLLLTAKHLD